MMINIDSRFKHLFSISDLRLWRLLHLEAASFSAPDVCISNDSNNDHHCAACIASEHWLLWTLEYRSILETNVYGEVEESGTRAQLYSLRKILDMNAISIVFQPIGTNQQDQRRLYAKHSKRINGFSGHRFEQAPGEGGGQGSLACCSPWGHKESGTIEHLNNINKRINIR